MGRLSWCYYGKWRIVIFLLRRVFLSPLTVSNLSSLTTFLSESVSHSTVTYYFSTSFCVPQNIPKWNVYIPPKFRSLSRSSTIISSTRLFRLSAPSECSTRVRIFFYPSLSCNKQTIGHPIYSSPRKAFSKNSLTSASTRSDDLGDWISS